MTDNREAADEGATNFLAVVKDHSPQLVLLDKKARAALFEHIEREVAERTFDLSTEAGRVACRKFAADITRTKTTLDDTAKKLTEEWRQKTAAVNAERKPIVDRLAELAKTARQPLTDWESAEAERLTRVENTITALNKDAEVSIETTAAEVEHRIARAEAIELPEDVFRGALPAAQEARTRTLSFLRAALERLKREEEERAELEALRAEKEARRLADEAREREEKAAREAEEAAEREKQEKARAAEIEAQRRKDSATAILSLIEGSRGDHAPAALPGIIRDLERIVPSTEAYGEQFEDVAAKRDTALAELRQRWNAEQERLKQAAAAEAAENATREAEARAAEAAAEAQRVADEALAAEQERAAAAERQAQAERDARAEQDRQRAEAEAAEKARREAAERDEAHRTLCKREAKLALMTIPGVDERMARDIVVLILADEVPRVSLDWAAEPRVVSAREAFEESRSEAPEAEAAEQQATLV